jgi:D-xylose 1-dehydrogenase (NADP+, D-xylono-1,5-lactone-forming)
VEPVRWGVLGAGWVVDRATGGAIASAAGAEWVALAARDAQRAERLAERFGVPVTYAGPGTYARLVADESVDAVYIALANDAHATWALRALDAGKHVLCEKPLALTGAEVREVAAAAAANDRLLVEASWYRWHPRVQLAQERLAAGAVGRVRHVAAGFTFSGVPEGNYRLDPARGGGALYDVGCYAVSAALWATGEQPVDVQARATTGPSGVDLTTDVVLDFPGGATAEVHVSIAEPERQWLVITGDAGEIELRHAPFTAWLGQHTELWVSDGGTTERMPVPADDAYRIMVEQVSAAVRGEPAWVVPVADSLATAEVLDAAREAARARG